MSAAARNADPPQVKPTRKAAQKARQMFKQILNIHCQTKFRHGWIYDPNISDDNSPSYLITILPTKQNIAQPEPDINEDLIPNTSQSYDSCESNSDKSSLALTLPLPSNAPSNSLPICQTTASGPRGMSKYSSVRNNLGHLLDTIPDPPLDNPSNLTQQLSSLPHEVFISPCRSSCNTDPVK